MLSERGPTYDSADKRTAIFRAEEKRVAERLAADPRNAPLPQDLFPWELAAYVVGAMLLMLGLSALIVWVMLKFIPQA